MLLYTLKKYSDDEVKSMILVRDFKVFHVMELLDEKINAKRGLIRHMNFGMGNQISEAHYVRKNNQIEVVNDPSERMLRVIMDYIDHSLSFSQTLVRRSA